MTAWRFIAQRALTGEFLDLELPFALKTLRWDLSGPGVLTGSVAPDTGTMRADDGRLLLEEWGTLLYAEADGEIRWGGIVVSSKFEGKEWQVEAAGFTTYPHGLPYTSTYSVAETDPATIVRHLWGNVQGRANGDLGVVVSGSTPVRIGSTSTERRKEANDTYNDYRATYNSENGTLKELRKAETAERKTLSSRTADKTAAGKALSAAKALKPKNQAAIDDAQNAYNAAVSRQDAQRAVVDAAARRTDTQAAVVKTAKSRLDLTKERLDAAKKREQDDGGAYELHWWETPDAGQEIDKLAQETPFDYVEEHAWDGDSIRHTVRIGYPRIGRRRADLAFVQGDNVSSLVTASIDGDGFANEVVGLGKGEGKGALRRTTAVADGRLRRTSIVKAKDVSKASRMDALIRDELSTRLDRLSIDSVAVTDHPNAPIGSWQVGDDVLIQATLPWLGEVALWCRITAWELTSESRAKLTLARSDSFIYGG